MTTVQGTFWKGFRPKRRHHRGRTQNEETILQKACLDWLYLHPGLVPKAWRTNAGMAFGGQMRGKGEGRYLANPFPVRLAPKGTSDIVGIMADGRFLAVEVKIPGEEPTADQVEFLTLVRSSGGVAMVVESVEMLAWGVKQALGVERAP